MKALAVLGFSFCVFLIVSSVSSCKKDEYAPYDTYVDGYIVDAATLDSVAGAVVELWEDDKGGSNLLGDYDRIIATAITDETGYYNIYFKCDPLKGKAIVAKKSLFFYGKGGFYDQNMDVSMFSCGRKNINYKIIPLSWIRVHIKNVSPSDEKDSIYFFPQLRLTGVSVDTVFYREIESPNTQLDIWDVTKGGITTRHSSVLKCSPFDTCSLNVFF
jgi:hypothetical protein